MAPLSIGAAKSDLVLNLLAVLQKIPVERCVRGLHRLCRDLSVRPRIRRIEDREENC